MKLKECLSEASREGRCGLCNSALGSGKLCSEAGQEVILCLLRSQNRYRRKYAECICGKENNVLCSRCGGNRTNDFLNVRNRIGNAGVLCYALVCKVDFSVCVQSYVLKKRVTLDCVVDIRFGFLVQVDNLCIASALKVEYAVVVPTVLIVAD